MGVTTWKTRDGKILKIKDMTDSHLVNTIRFLKRNAPLQLLAKISAGWSCLNMVSGEMAQEEIERDLMRLCDMSDQEFLEDYTPFLTMIWHAKRRGLEY